MESNSISLTELKRIFNIMIDKVKLDHVKIQNQYYWRISNEDVFNVDENPTVSELGDIFEDWEELIKFKEEDMLLKDYSLDLFCGILRCISAVATED